MIMFFNFIRNINFEIKNHNIFNIKMTYSKNSFIEFKYSVDKKIL